MIIEKPITGIYKITNLKNNRVYIGQSGNIQFRWICHIVSSINNNTNELHKEMHDYGIENFKLEIIEQCSLEELNDREEYYIKKLPKNPKPYNKYSNKYYRNSTNNLKENIKITNFEIINELTPPLTIEYNKENNEYIIKTITAKKIVNGLEY